MTFNETIDAAIADIPVPAFFQEQLDAYYAGEYAPEDADKARVWIEGLRDMYPSLKDQYDKERAARLQEQERTVSAEAVRVLVGAA